MRLSDNEIVISREGLWSFSENTEVPSLARGVTFLSTGTYWNRRNFF